MALNQFEITVHNNAICRTLSSKTITKSTTKCHHKSMGQKENQNIHFEISSTNTQAPNASWNEEKEEEKKRAKINQSDNGQ